MGLRLDAILPQWMQQRINAEAFGISEFVEFVSTQVQSSDRILDAGAGACQYKKYFRHAHYESTDMEEGATTAPKGRHDFSCSLDAIPRPDNFYDAILNTQVLAHAE